MPIRKNAEVTARKLRSAISNGSQVLAGVDHRSGWMRRLRDITNDHLSDLGGEDRVSQAERVLVRRAAVLCLQCELLESKWAVKNDGVATADDLQLYQRTSSALRRILESLGLQRRTKDVAPSLHQYLRQRRNGSNQVIDAEADE